MTRNSNSRNGGSRATSKTYSGRHPGAIRSSIKVAIVHLALWGIIPADFATWLIQRGGLKDA